MKIDNNKLKEKLAIQMLPNIKVWLEKVPNDSLYQKCFGKFRINGYNGELLIEFDENNPVAGIYYGFKIHNENGFKDYGELENIDKVFLPMIQYFESKLNKVVYITDNCTNIYYWAFWLRCNDYDLNLAVKHMEFIRDYFNQIIISKYDIQAIILK